MDVARPAGADASEQLLEAMPDAVIVVDATGRVARVNRQAEILSGYCRDELLGMAVEQLVPEALRATHVANRLAYLGAPVRRPMGTHLDLRVRRRDGSEFPADIALSPVVTELGVQVVAAVRDVTERKRQDDRLGAVVEVAQAALEGRPEADLLRLIVQLARGLVDSATTAIALFGAAGEAPVVAGSLDAGGPGPSLAVALASGQRTIGSLSATRAAGDRPFAEADRELLELFAAQAAVAIGYSRVRDELQRFAVLEDRERIGRELHDGAIQALFAVGMGLQGMAMMTSDPVLRERLDGTVVRIDGVIRDLRNYIFGLRPGIAADRHLARALRELADELEEQHGVVCAVDVDEGLAARLSARAADIVQLTREALSNVGRHAGATTCRLSLRGEPGLAVLEVDDDGHGFTPGKEQGGGWGLRNLRERAAAMGGTLDVASVLGEGTAVTLRVPV